MKIGELAFKTGVAIDTVRFYEREGLIDPPPRTSSGYRNYPDTSIDLIHFIRQAKNLGYTLSEIAQLKEFRVSPPENCGVLRENVLEKIKEIDEKIRVLEEMRSALKVSIENCNDQTPFEDCDSAKAIGKKP